MGGNSLFSRNIDMDKNAVVVVTGASSGMGRALALKYAERGCRVVIGARRLERLQEVVDKAMRFGNKNVVAV